MIAIMIFVSIATLIFYVFTGLLITLLRYEDTTTVSMSRLIISVIVWPAVVLLFLSACAVFSVETLTNRLRSIL